MSLEPTLLSGTEKAPRKTSEEIFALEELSRDGMHGAEQSKAEIQVCSLAVQGDVGPAWTGATLAPWDKTSATRMLAGVWLESLLISFLSFLWKVRGRPGPWESKRGSEPGMSQFPEDWAV